MPIWLQVILGTATPLIAIAGVVVAFQQWLVGQRVLKHDLFDRRWAVYAATNDVIATHLAGDHQEANDRLEKFKRSKMDAVFLLPDATNTFLDAVLVAVRENRDARRELSTRGANAPISDTVEKEMTRTDERLKTLLGQLTEQFRPALDLSK